MRYYSNEDIREEYDIRERDYLFWGAFTLEGLELLSKLDLTSLQFKVLLFLCSQIEQKDNTAYVKQTEIQKEIYKKIHEKTQEDTQKTYEIFNKSNISKATKTLRIKNLIAKVQKGYMINPNLFYLGKKDNNQLYSLHKTFKEKMDNDPIYNATNRNDIENERLPFNYPEI